MKNIDLIRKFTQGATDGVGSNLYIAGNDLVNYTTIIASRVPGGVRLNARRYSMTTTRVQNVIRKECNVISEYC